MAYSAMVSFKLAPEHLVLKPIAESQGRSMSELVRETVEYSLNLDVHARRFSAFIAQSAEE